MITQNTQGFWTRKWALQPVRLCCRGKPWRCTIKRNLFEMKLTESHLRVIIKEELNTVLNEMDLSTSVGAFGGRGGIGKSKKQEREEREEAKNARHARALANSGNPVSQADLDVSSKSTNLNNLAVELLKSASEQDKDYVQTFLSTKDGKVQFENFVGPEFRKEFQDLADKADKDKNLDTLAEFKKIANEFAPMRGSEGIGGKITRGLARAFYNPRTKE